ncbi:MAG: DNA polymerase I [Planctomycetota bacterium]|nr:DNA polymerase I [Planctomycetota bacterium]MCX8040133.1 DNA polymerase I [Planctomycetota bacterium]MDW8373409.1 DNA polymerase I [Planctomycetota bacterium]
MTAAPRPRLVIIDGHYYAYRFHFGMPPLSGPGGRPTGVTYAFANLVRELKADERVTHLACVFDAEAPSFRHQLYPEYKAQREPMPETLAVQIPDVLEILRALHVPVIRAPGYEADDVLFTYARLGEAAGWDVLLYTRDKDIDQALSERVHTYDVMKQQERGPAELYAEKGIRPEQVIDYLALIGDSADNVPGVEGVGPKTAAKLLAEHGTLERVLAASHRGKLAERLAAFAPRAELTRRLIALVMVPDLPPLASLAVDRRSPADPAPFVRLGFQVARFSPRAEPAAASDGADYEILTADSLPAYCERLARAGRFAIDTETTGLDPLRARLVGISFACGERGGKGAAWLPLLGPQGEIEPWGRVAEPLARLLGDARVRKLGQNIKFDAQMLAAAGLPVAGYDGDTMLASWLLDPSRDSHDLDHLATVFLAERKIPTSEVADLKRGQTMAEADPALVARYACEDAQVAWRLAQILEGKLAEQDLLAVYREQEVPLALVLADIERAGMLVDRQTLADCERHFAAYLEQVQREIRRLTSADFNPASPKQVAEWLFQRLGLPVIARTASGPSTEAGVLEVLRHLHPLPDLILQHRQLSKLIGSYVARLPDFIAADGRIHTHLRQTGTETGRLSSDQPNLQNIPKTTELGREIRAAFVAPPDKVLIAADYAQIELRVLAELSGDEALNAAFAAGEDIHARVAAELHGIPLEQVTPRQRQAAKAVNFGIIYGQTPFGLAQTLGIGREEAQRFIERYFARYPAVRGYIERTIAEARERGFVRTLAGRRRFVPGLASSNKNERMAAERVAINSTIQGSAADLIKRAMLAMHRCCSAETRLILQVHDELILEAPAALATEAAAQLTAAMRGAAAFRVPLEAAARIGRNWLEVS